MDLLKTPSQVREEQLAKLRAEGQAASQRALLGGQGGSAISGAISSLAAQGQAMLPQATENLKRGGLLGLGGIASSLGAEDLGSSLQTAAIPAAERDAMAQQELARGMGNTPESIRATADRLEQAGNVKAAMALRDRAGKLEATAAETAIKQQELDLKRKEVSIKEANTIINEFKAQTQAEKDRSARELGISSDVIENSSVRSVAAALTYLNETGDTAGAVGLLEDKPTTSTTVINQAERQESKFKEKLGQEDAKNFVEINNAASTSVDSIATIERMQKMLDSEGGIYTGTLANVQMGLSKAMNLVGMSNEEKVARTEAFLTQGARETLNILGSGVVGAGTGISDKDREFIEKVVGGNITLSEQGIRDILRINKTVSMDALKNYNEKVDEYNERYNESLPKKYFVGQRATVNGEPFVYNGNQWVKE